MTSSQASWLQVGAIAQLVERVLCKHEVVGSTPTGSTKKAFYAIVENEFPVTLARPGALANDIVN